MKGDDRLLSFNYLDVLSALEQECRGLAKGADPIPDAIRGRLREFGSLRIFVGKAQNVFRLRDREIHRVKLGIGIAAEKIREKEGRLLDSIARLELSESGSSAPRNGNGFPGIIGSQELVGRLVATVLGLHAEHRYEKDVAGNLRASLARSAESILAPALAWNLLLQIERQHPDHHGELIRKAVESLRTGFLGANPGSVDWNDRTIVLPALAMARAWMKLLRDTYGLQETEVARAIGESAADLIKSDDLEVALARLKPAMRESFEWGAHGSERALAIHLAHRSGGSHAGIESRVDLLQAATSARARTFEQQLNRDAGAALEQVDKDLNAEFPSPLEPAGLAFWLSRFGFRKTQGANFHLTPNGVVDLGKSAEACLDLNRASELFLKAMEVALKSKGLRPEQRLLLLRFRAGYATNPRFWRAPKVLAQSSALVTAYAQETDAKPGLIAHFKARLLLQDGFAEGKDGAKMPLKALKGYLEVLQKIKDAPHALDAEAPLHLFPEIVAVLSMGPKDNRTKVREALVDVDLILSRNFGVYIDIDVEEACILGGLRQASLWRQSVAASGATEQART